MADAEAREARECRADRLAADPEPAPQPAPDAGVRAGVDDATAAPSTAQDEPPEGPATAEPEPMPTLEDDLLSQALAMGPEQFPASSLCLAARTARSPRRFALREAQKQLAALGWQPEMLPKGVDRLGPLGRLSSTRVLEGLTVSAPATEPRLCRLLRAFGASVTHTDDTADFCCSPTASETTSRPAQGHDASSPPPIIPAAALEMFIFSPFVSSSESFNTGKELSEDQVVEVLQGYAGYECVVCCVFLCFPTPVLVSQFSIS